MNALLQDTMFIYAVTLTIFVALFWWKGRKHLLTWLDKQILAISQELEQAHQLRREADEMLAAGKIKQLEALAEAEKIVEHAKSEAQRMRLQAEADVKQRMALQERQIVERIAIAEAEAVEAIRVAMIDAAVRMAEETLRTGVDASAAERLIEQALAELPSLSSKKAKAA